MTESTFGMQIQKLRKDKGITQEQLADYMGVSPQAISKWENGSYPNGDLLPRLADFFGVSIDFLYGREKEQVSLEQQLLEAIRDVSGKEATEKKKAEQFEQMFRYIWAMQIGCWSDSKYYYDRGSSLGETRMASCTTNRSGFSYMRQSMDLEFFAIIKEPEKGFSSFFQVTDELAELFAFLGKKENLQILFYMLSLETDEFVSAASVAERLKLSEECVEKMLDYLSSFYNGNGILTKVNLLNMNDTKQKVYGRQEVFSAMPLLLLAAADSIIHPAESFVTQIASRQKGWLSREPQINTEGGKGKSEDEGK